MMHGPHFRAIFTAAAAIWVGGWGFIIFHYPEFFARINDRFGMQWLSGSKYLSPTRKMGTICMVITALSVFVFLVEAALGLARF